MSFLKKLLGKAGSDIKALKGNMAEDRPTSITVTNTATGSSETTASSSLADARTSAESTVASAPRNIEVANTILDIEASTQAIGSRLTFSTSKGVKKGISLSMLPAKSEGPQAAGSQKREPKREAPRISFEPLEQTIPAAKKISAVLGELIKNSSVQGYGEQLDSLFPKIKIGGGGGAASLALSELLKGDRLQGALTKYATILDTMQAAPQRIRSLQPYSIRPKKGYYIIDSYASTGSYFVLGDLNLPTGDDNLRITDMCFCSVGTIIQSQASKSKGEPSSFNVLTMESIAAYSRVLNDVPGELYILSDDLRSRFLYALLKLSGAFNVANTAFKALTSSTGATLTKEITAIDKAKADCNRAINDYLKKVIGTNNVTPASQETMLEELLACYQLGLGYSLFEGTRDTLKIEASTAPFNAPSLSMLDTPLVRLIDNAASIPQIGLLGTQFDLEYLPTPYIDKVQRTVDINKDSDGESNSSFDILKNIEGWWGADSASKYGYTVAWRELLDMYKVYSKSQLANTSVQGLLNALEVPKLLGDYLCFVCDARLCYLKLDYEQGLWGFISNELKELQMYKLASPYATRRLETLSSLLVNRAGELFSNPYIDVINSMLNKAADRTASKLISLQRGYIDAFNATKGGASPVLKGELLGSSMSYGCGVVPSKTLAALEGLTMLQPNKEATGSLTIELEALAKNGSARAKQVLRLIRKNVSGERSCMLEIPIEAMRLALQEGTVISFDIAPVFFGLIQELAAAPTDAFLNIIELYKVSSKLTHEGIELKGQSEWKRVSHELLRTEAFDPMLPAAIQEDPDRLFTDNEELGGRLSTSLLLTSHMGTIIIPLSGKTKRMATNSTSVWDVSAYSEATAARLLDRLKKKDTIGYTLEQLLYLARYQEGQIPSSEDSPSYKDRARLTATITSSGSTVAPYKFNIIDAMGGYDPVTRFTTMLSEARLESLVDAIVSDNAVVLKELFEPNSLFDKGLSESKGFMLFRDAWSSGYTLRQLKAMEAITLDERGEPLFDIQYVNRPGEDTSARLGVSFKDPGNTSFELSYRLQLHEHSNMYYPYVYNRLQDYDGYLRSQAADSKARGAPIKLLPVYFQKGKNSSTPAVLSEEYFTRELLEEELRQYFPAYFAGRDDEQYTPPALYPKNAVLPSEIASDLIDYMLELKESFKPAGLTMLLAHRDERLKIPKIHPEYARLGGFAGELFLSLKPFSLYAESTTDSSKRLGGLKLKGGYYESISPIRYRLYLRLDTASGWIDASLANARGINLFRRFNSFHAIELMSGVPVMDKDINQAPVEVPLWQVLVDHYSSLGLEVAFVPGDKGDALTNFGEEEGVAVKKLYLPTSGAFPPNFFMLNRAMFLEGFTEKRWWELTEDAQSSLRNKEEHELVLDDYFLIETGFYYYLAYFNPLQGDKSSMIIASPDTFSAKALKMLKTALSGLVTVSAYQGDYERLVAESGGKSSAIIDGATVAYAKLVSWWIDLDVNTREYFIRSYLQPNASSFLYKLQLPQQQNAVFPPEKWPNAMRKKLQAKSFEYKDYQKQAINTAINQSRLIFSMEMGLGKTISAITTFFLLKEDPSSGIDRMIILLPYAPIKSWKDELKNRVENGENLYLNTNEEDPEKCIAAFERGDKPILILKQHTSRYSEDPLDSSTIFHRLIKMLDRVGSKTFFVIDELHEFKGLTAQQGRGARELSTKCKRVLGMTGTLKPNRIVDIFSALETVVPGIFKRDSEYFIDKYGLKGDIPALRETTFNPMLLNQFYRTIAPYVFTRVVDPTGLSTHPEAVQITLQPIISVTPKLENALSPEQVALLNAILLVKECHKRIKDSEARTISLLEKEIKGLDIDIRRLQKDLAAVEKSTAFTEAQKAIEKGRLDDEIARIAASVEDAKAKLILAKGEAEFLRLMETLKRGDVKVLFNEQNTTSEGLGYYSEMNAAIMSLIPRGDPEFEQLFQSSSMQVLRMAAVIKPHEMGVFPNAYEKLILSPRVLVNSEINAFQKEFPGKDEGWGWREFWDAHIPNGYVSSKMEFVANSVKKELTENPEFNCLVFGFYTESLKEFKRAMMTKDVEDGHIAIIDGSVSTADRDKLISRFNGDLDERDEPLRVLIASINVLATGANLQSRSKYVAFLTTPYSPSQLTQAQGRVWRMGQKHKVTVVRPSCTFIDDRKEARLTQKMNANSQSAGVSGAGDNSVAEGLAATAKTGADLYSEFLQKGISVFAAGRSLRCYMNASEANRAGSRQSFAFYSGVTSIPSIESKVLDALTSDSMCGVEIVFMNSYLLPQYPFCVTAELYAELKKYAGFEPQLSAAVAELKQEQEAKIRAYKDDISKGNMKPVYLCQSALIELRDQLVNKNFLCSSSGDGLVLDTLGTALEAKMSSGDSSSAVEGLASFIHYAELYLELTEQMLALLPQLQGLTREISDLIRARKFTKKVGRALSTSPDFFEERAFMPQDVIFGPYLKEALKKTLDKEAGVYKNSSLPYTSDQILDATLEALKPFLVRPEFNFLGTGMRGLLFNSTRLETLLEKVPGLPRHLDYSSLAQDKYSLAKALVCSPSIALKDFWEGARNEQYRPEYANDPRGVLGGLLVYLSVVQHEYLLALLSANSYELAQNDDLLDRIYAKAEKLWESPSDIGTTRLLKEFKGSSKTKHVYRTQIAFSLKLSIPLQDMTNEFFWKSALTASENGIVGEYDPSVLGAINIYSGVEGVDFSEGDSKWQTLEQFKANAKTLLEGKPPQNPEVSFESVNKLIPKRMEFGPLPDSQSLSEPEIGFLDTGYELARLSNGLMNSPKRTELINKDTLASIPMLPYYGGKLADGQFPMGAHNSILSYGLRPELLNSPFLKQTSTKEGLAYVFDAPLAQGRVSLHSIFLAEGDKSGNLYSGEQRPAPTQLLDSLKRKGKEASIESQLEVDLGASYSIGTYFKLLELYNSKLYEIKQGLKALDNQARVHIDKELGVFNNAVDMLDTKASMTQLLNTTSGPGGVSEEIVDADGETTAALTPDPEGASKQQLADLQKELGAMTTAKKHYVKEQNIYTKAVVLAARFSAVSMLRAVFFDRLSKRVELDEFLPSTNLQTQCDAMLDELCPHEALDSAGDAVISLVRQSERSTLDGLLQSWRSCAIQMDRLEKFLIEKKEKLASKNLQPKQVEFLEKIITGLHSRVERLGENTRLLEAERKKQRGNKA